MKTSSDVNTIFAYGNRDDIFNKKVLLFRAKKMKYKYVLLSNVSASFVYTYKDRLSTGCIVIEKAIREEKKKRDSSPSKSYKPSLFSLSENVNNKISEYLVELQRDNNINVKSVRIFIDLLLSDYSIPRLYEEDEAFAEFKEKYIINAEKRAFEVINKFVRFFRRYDFMYIENYQKYDEWKIKIKSSKEQVFDKKRDKEDIEIATEFLSFNEEFGQLEFFTCDKECGESIKKIAKEYRRSVGHIEIIRK